MISIGQFITSSPGLSRGAINIGRIRRWPTPGLRPSPGRDECQHRLLVPTWRCPWLLHHQSLAPIHADNSRTVSWTRPGPRLKGNWNDKHPPHSGLGAYSSLDDASRAQFRVPAKAQNGSDINSQRFSDGWYQEFITSTERDRKRSKTFELTVNQSAIIQ